MAHIVSLGTGIDWIALDRQERSACCKYFEVEFTKYEFRKQTRMIFLNIFKLILNDSFIHKIYNVLYFKTKIFTIILYYVSCDLEYRGI